MSTSGDCIFCKIVRGDIPSHVIYEDEHFKAILDTQPASAGHTVILSKEHAESLSELSNKSCSRLFPLVKKLAGVIVSAVGAEGANILQNDGEAAGQTIFHFHTHIIPRRSGDGVVIKWDGTGAGSEELSEIKSKIITECYDKDEWWS